jgi:hypothetical protein
MRSTLVLAGNRERKKSSQTRTKESRCSKTFYAPKSTYETFAGLAQPASRQAESVEDMWNARSQASADLTPGRPESLRSGDTTHRENGFFYGPESAGGSVKD